MITAELVRETEARFAERAPIRAERVARIDAGNVLDADTPDRVRERLQRIARMTIETEGVGPPPGQFPAAGVDALERIMGKNDLMSVRYLELAIRIARTVGRIQIRNSSGKVLGYGTGFMVSPRLMLTNNHVLGSAAAAAPSRVEFDFQEGVDGHLLSSIVVNFDPASFFATDKTLDFTLVALKGDLSGITRYGWNGLSAAEGKVIAGEFVSIIQHPSGERKQIAIRENRIVDVLEQFLHYHTDTAPGSSGSPVFNDQWEVVALHHSGVPKKDSEGRILTVDGKVWTKSMGDNAIAWIANEGVRISRILKHVTALTLSGAASTLRKQMLESDAGWRLPSGTSPREAVESLTGTEHAMTGSVWTLPLQLSIDVSRSGGSVRIAPAGKEQLAGTEAEFVIPPAVAARMNGNTNLSSVTEAQFESATPSPDAEETAESWLLS